MPPAVQIDTTSSEMQTDDTHASNEDIPFLSPKVNTVTIDVDSVEDDILDLVNSGEDDPCLAFMECDEDMFFDAHNEMRLNGWIQGSVISIVMLTMHHVNWSCTTWQSCI